MVVVNAAETAVCADFHICLVLHSDEPRMIRVFPAGQGRQMGNAVISPVQSV